MIIILIALFILLSVSLISVLIVGPKMIVVPHKRKPDYYQEKFGFSHPSHIGLKYKECSLKTEDGLSLSYWVINNQGSKELSGTIIYLHGITDSKVSGLNYARQLIEYCHSIFLIDMRHHGNSEGEYCTFGYHEKKDVVTLIDRIKNESPDRKIILLGVSMGAAIAIQTAAIDKRVDKVVAIAPFYDLFSIALDHQVRKIGVKSKILLRLVLRRAEHLAKFKASDVSPANDIPKIKVPILIVHGENDRSVKREYPARLKEMNVNARLITVPGAGHVDVLEKGGKMYLEQILEFIKNGK